MKTKDKRIAAFITSLLLVFSLFSSLSVVKVQAYSNPSIFQDIRVGLVTMSNAALTAVLNGSYTLNGVQLPTGTTLNIRITNGLININGTEYSDVQLLPLSPDNLLVLTSGTTTLKYLGKFSFKVVSGKVLPVNSLDLESYLKGVVANEMSDYYPIEALKAQAVAARNYALKRLGSEASKGYDFDDTTLYQTYKGYDIASVNTIRAVNETKWIVLLYNDALVETMYSAWHGGYTEDSANVWGNATPYLKSKPDSYEIDPWPNGNRTFTDSQIDTTLKGKGYLLSTDTFVKLDLSSITRYPSYRVSNINVIYRDIAGVTKSKSFTMDKARTFLSLPSSMYDIVYSSTAATYTFTGKGFGHGLGMSQIGAKNRAAAGQTYDTILKFYYDGSYLQNLTPKASMTGFTLSSSQVYTQEPVTISAQGTGGSGQYQYKYQIIKDGSPVYSSEYSDTSTLSYQPMQSGNYEIDAYLKDKFSPLQYDAMQSKVLSVTARPVALMTAATESTDKILVAQPVTLQASGTDGTLYRFEILRNGISVQSSEYTTSANFVYTPSQSGYYTANIYSKHSLSLNQYDDMKALSFTVYAAPSVSALSLDKTSLLVGQSISATASAISGSGDYLYGYQISASDGTSIYSGDFNTANTLNFTPSTTGNYIVTMFIKDKVSQSSYDAQSTAAFTVYSSPTVSAYTSSNSQVFTGQKIDFNTAAQGGSGNYQYKFVVLKDWNYVTETQYTRSNTYSYTPSTSGNYQVYVYLKDDLGTSYSEMKSLPFTAYPAPVITSLKSTGTMYQKTPVTVTAGIYSVSPAGMQVRYQVYNNNLLLEEKNIGSSTSFTYTPDKAGKFTVIIYVKDNLSINNYDTIKQFDMNISTAPMAVSVLPIQYGMRGTDVATIQNGLNKLGFNVGTVDGIFGLKTQTGVINFQKSAALKATGIVDFATFNAMNDALVKTADTKTIVY